MAVVAGVAAAQGGPWEEIYWEDFSSDPFSGPAPTWFTNAPTHFQVQSGELVTVEINGSDEWAYTAPVGLRTDRRLRLEFDYTPTAMPSHMASHLLLADADMRFGSPTFLGFFYQDGWGPTLCWTDDDDPDPSYEYLHFNVDISEDSTYHTVLEWDPTTGIFSAHVTGTDGMDEGRSVDLYGRSFTGIDRIAVSTLGDDWDPGARIESSYDNIVLSVPEPATMGLLALAGLAVLRRRRR